MSAGKVAHTLFFMTELKFLLGQQTGLKAGACFRSLVLSCCLDTVFLATKRVVSKGTLRPWGALYWQFAASMMRSALAV